MTAGSWSTHRSKVLKWGCLRGQSPSDHGSHNSTVWFVPPTADILLSTLANSSGSPEELLLHRVSNQQSSWGSMNTP